MYAKKKIPRKGNRKNKQHTETEERHTDMDTERHTDMDTDMVQRVTLYFLGNLKSDGMLANGTASCEDRCQAISDRASTSGGVFGQIVSVLL